MGIGYDLLGDCGAIRRVYPYCDEGGVTCLPAPGVKARRARVRSEALWK